MSDVERIPLWSWEVHTVATAYHLSPAEVRSWSLWRVHETAAHVMLARILEGV